MKIPYKCWCMPVEDSVDVAERLPEDSVTNWVTAVGIAVGQHHKARFPLCAHTTAEYVKIPFQENTPFLGGKPVLHS